MKIPVTNNTAMPMYVGATMVPAGETYHFEEDMVPLHLRPVKQEEAVAEMPGDALAELLDGNVDSVVAALPGLTIEQLELLGDMEQADKKRKGVLSALAEALLTRAANKDELDKVALLSDEELATELAAVQSYGTASDYLAALEAESARRKAE